MGGGGSGPGRIGDVGALIEKAKQHLRESADQGRRNVFLSFAYEDLNAVNLLRGQARNDNLPLEFNDWSVSEPYDSDRASYIKEKIADRIERSSVTVVYLSGATANSRWVEWEIQESVRRGKHVVGVHAAGSKPGALPPSFAKHRIKSVAWADLATTIARLR